MHNHLYLVFVLTIAVILGLSTMSSLDRLRASVQSAREAAERGDQAVAASVTRRLAKIDVLLNEVRTAQTDLGDRMALLEMTSTNTALVAEMAVSLDELRISYSKLTSSVPTAIHLRQDTGATKIEDLPYEPGQSFHEEELQTGGAAPVEETIEEEIERHRSIEHAHEKQISPPSVIW